MRLIDCVGRGNYCKGVLNAIWLGLILAAVALAVGNGRMDALAPAAFEAARNAVMNLALPLGGLMAFWLGLMRLGERAGLVKAVAEFLRPVLARLFPDVPVRHPAMGAMVMNMAANMLGLSNAATPLGLKAMKGLEALNAHPGVASNAMCTFLAINTSSVQLIPATAVAILASAGAREPGAIIGTALVATACSTAAALVAVKLLERVPFYRLPQPDAENAERVMRECEAAECGEERSEVEEKQGVPKAVRGMVWMGMAALFAWGGWVAVRAALDKEGSGFAAVVQAVGVVALPFVFAVFPIAAALKRVRVYEEFVDGAKEGLEVALRIVPYLVAILTAIGMFRAAGGLDALGAVAGGLLDFVGIPHEVLPLMVVRPLSGSGALGIFAELVKTHGPDSFVSRLAGTVMGSTETTFYVLAVYFGSVNVKRPRHALPAGLFADVCGMVAAVMVCRWVFSS